jgi:cytochrome c oxidase assembly factor CtaG
LVTPDERLAFLRYRSRAERLRTIAADVLVYSMVVIVAIIVAWTMIRLDARSEELAQFNRLRFGMCVCATPVPP